MTQDYLDKLKQSIIQNINRLEDEIVNLRYIVIKNLQDKNAILKMGYEKIESRVTILESNHNGLAQYGRRNNENMSKNSLEKTVILVFSDIDIETTLRHIDPCHQVGKPASKI